MKPIRFREFLDTINKLAKSKQINEDTFVRVRGGALYEIAFGPAMDGPGNELRLYGLTREEGE